MFHHLFVCGMDDISNTINGAGQYSLVFEKKAIICPCTSACGRKTFRAKFTCSSALLDQDIEGELGSFARFLSAVSSEPDFVACSGVPHSFIQTFDKSAFFKRSVQYLYRFDNLNLDKRSCIKEVIAFSDQ